MRNILLVIRHEIVSTLGRPSFWFMTFIFPVLIMGFSLLPGLLAQNAIEDSGGLPGVMQSGVRTIGYVDLGGAVKDLPPKLPADAVRAFADEAAAQAALDAGEIAQYFLLPADLAQTGQITAVSNQSAPLAGIGPARTIEYLVTYNLTGDPLLAQLIMDPLGQLETRALSPDVTADTSSSPMGFTLPFIVMFVLFFVITMSGGYMLQSVSKEKENYTAEVLLVSLRPRELMLGKVVGLGTVALLQMVIWLGGGMVLLGSGLAMASLAGGQGLPLSFIFWAIVYFLLGYIMYASALGALGALAPTAREGAQFTFVLILPLIVPFYLNNVFASQPNGTIPTVLSLFPLTAPTAMIARMSAVSVPVWQLALSVAGLAVTAYLFVLLAARFFRADTLLSSATLNWGRIASEFRKG